ncbi:MAG TPA: cytochrome c/FTR1 family iron permease [Gemmatimonadales bacterium]|nr:cytochrome c/FTR1 family iron permease [Gemmatimonadales bacterium]
MAAAALAAKEYSAGVPPAGGKVDEPEEVEESKLFIQQARYDIPSLPAAVRGGVDSGLTQIALLLDRLAPPDSVRRAADALIARIGTDEPIPSRPLSVARGGEVFRENCAACHGEAGRGDGPKARSLKGPLPPNLTDPAVMGGTSLLEIYRRVAIGVPGTAMPEFADEIPEADRWAVAAYVAALQYGGSASGATFASMRRQIDSSLAARSEQMAFGAYLTFEQVETDVQARNASLAGEIEAAFDALRTHVRRGDQQELAAIRQRLLAALERAERAMVDRPSAMNLFVSSFILMVREGFEAILIVAALMAFLAKAGAPERRREVARGAWVAVGASVVTWALVELLFQITPGQRGAIEGFTMLLAAVVLFYVSYWLLSKIEAAKWTAFVKDKMESALSSGSGLALSAVAFLAVYREGFETILFYKALFGSAGSDGTVSILVGIAAGAVGLVAVYVLINQLGLRVAMKPFFAVTGAMLYYMAFVFAGKGVAELQEGGVVGLTVVEGVPRIPFLGIYPTLESLALQGLLVILAVVALVWAMKPSARPASTTP